jgi:hypothetical protein
LEVTGRSAIARQAAGIRRAAALVLLLSAVALGAASASPAGDQKQKSQKQKQQAYALLAGAVFDENGRRVPGADIRVREKDGKRHWEAVTDASGEFAVRLPAGTVVYIVGASRRGFSADSKEVTIGADERQDISLSITRIGSGGS